MKTKKIPMRTCAVSMEKLPKKELIRVVRNKEGEVFVDPTGKMNGRGVYLKKDRNIKKAIYLDEIWRLIGVTSNKEVASFIYKIFKTIRKYGGSGVAITQDVSDLFSLENGTYGKSIINNSSIKAFFSLEEENIKTLSDYTNLTEKEKVEIKSLKKGECLMFIGDNHILANIEAAEFEKDVIIEVKNNEHTSIY